jgi:site-specific recombinase XerD
VTDERSRSEAPRSLAPREAVNRFVNSKREEISKASAKSYRYRLKLFVEWCEGNGIAFVDDLDGWDFDTYENTRRGNDVAPSTLQNEMKTLRNFTKYLERIEVVEDGLHEKIHIPDVSRAAKSDDTMLTPDDGLALVRGFRNDPELYGRQSHALLELAWHTGARMGSLRALDLRDVYLEEQYVDFRHRPETGTPLKNGIGGERPVAFPDPVADVLDRYVEHHRRDRHDTNGREPLLSSMQGRPTKGTIRDWMYRATFPCHVRECPHGRDPVTCEFKEHNKASQCPSSRSPHQVRTGSITWQLDVGVPPEVVAERVNSSIDIIEQHYDKASAIERMNARRRPHIEKMGFCNELDQ